MKLVFFLICAVIIGSCSNSTNKIIGKWKLEEINYDAYINEIPEEMRESFSSNLNREQERIKNKIFYQFNENGELIIEAPNEQGEIVQQKAKWETNDSKDSIFFQLDEREGYKIAELSETVFLLSTDEMPKRALRFSKVN